MTADAPPIPMLLSVREAALAMRLCERTIRDLVTRGELRAARFGRAVRIDPRDLQAMIDARKGGGR